MPVIVNLMAFQVGWFTCVLGGSRAGGIVVALILAGHWRWLARPGEWRWLVGFAGLGFAVETALTLGGGYDFGTPPRVLPPAWLWLLWPLFATLLHHGLAWLWHRPWLAIGGGALGGTTSYAVGARLADVELAVWMLPVQAVLWGALCGWLCRRLGTQR
ncbi:Protein of unknown function [Billgrantia gudaonensis]|uniref:DUF2878 domain-containing protein n=2 Tax=Billgrantia gudaonensis TaxID=376427 RepID=A0A1G9C6F9_9GAMM|nr:Protein of unknown function [Halomonas gudaonensis]